ncbi:MAG: methylenetetrahydrofolate--tRNA-(uracil(54)-C(5))-methyltransferase (FADH(2)-oxidizing) TrmFO [Eubacteriales bacterium]
MKTINVIGAGLAGCEAAYQAAKRGVKVFLYEMKPKKYSPAHKSPLFAELVCSNSMRSNQITNAVGLLKEEMRLLDSIVIEAATDSEVPAGSALAVDRNNFSEYITEKLTGHPNIEIIHDEVTSFDENNITVIATGPLTSPTFSEYISDYIGVGQLYFYDAAAPIIDASTINMDHAFFASRYNKGEASYLNCPMTADEYDIFYNELINARQTPLKQFEIDPKVFEGCMPVEIMAKRGYDTLRYGPMKPVGLINPHDGQEAYAVVQLRQENIGRTMYNLVGFQTHLTFEEQRRVFGLIPGLENAKFLRYGVMHRNTFIDSPKLLTGCYSVRKNPNVFFAGQITGVEGYVESASSGIVAGINAARYALGQDLLDFPDITVIGALAHYISDPNITVFQPMNANFGIVKPLPERVKGGKIKKYEAIANRSIDYMKSVCIV